MFLLATFFKEPFARQRHLLDNLGAIVITGDIVTCLFFVRQGGTA